MTLWERVEALTKRVGELEAQRSAAAKPAQENTGPEPWVAARLKQMASEEARVVFKYFTVGEWEDIVSLARARVAPEKP